MATNVIPDDRSYTEEHEWVQIAPGAHLPDSPVRVGITSVAVDSLGELVFVDPPAVGTTLAVAADRDQHRRRRRSQRHQL